MKIATYVHASVFLLPIFFPAIVLFFGWVGCFPIEFGHVNLNRRQQPCYVTIAGVLFYDLNRYVHLSRMGLIRKTIKKPRSITNLLSLFEFEALTLLYIRTKRRDDRKKKRGLVNIPLLRFDGC